MKPVYELFYSLLSNDVLDSKILKEHLNRKFLSNYIGLFEYVYGIDELKYMKNILHKIYLKVNMRRKLLRLIILDKLLEFIYEKDRYRGMSEILEFYSSVVAGFTVPLKDEHMYFFRAIVIGLHKVQTSYLYKKELL